MSHPSKELAGHVCIADRQLGRLKGGFHGLAQLSSNNGRDRDGVRSSARRALMTFQPARLDDLGSDLKVI